MKHIIVIHGPNLDLLGERQPEIYGTQTLDELNREIISYGKSLDCEVSCFQSNSESEIIDRLHTFRNDAAGIIINPAGFCHTSVAILDALLAVTVPVVEVHLSNLYKREDFRRTSLTARGALGIISGLGKYGYLLAVKYISDLYQEKQK